MAQEAKSLKQQFKTFFHWVRGTASHRPREVAVLDEDERSALLRARAFFEHMIPLLVALARNAKLALPRHNLDEMIAAAEKAADAQPSRDELAKNLRALDDFLLVQRSTAWRTFLAYYNVLSSMAGEDAELAESLKPIVEFMATGKRPKPATNDDAEVAVPKPVVVNE